MVRFRYLVVCQGQFITETVKDGNSTSICKVTFFNQKYIDDTSIQSPQYDCIPLCRIVNHDLNILVLSFKCPTCERLNALEIIFKI